MMCRLVTAVLVGTVLCSPVFGMTIQVPGDQPTIQAGIDAAVEGDTVLVADGVYHGEGNLDITFSGKAVVLKSVNGAEFTTISYRYFEDGFFASGCLRIDAGEGAGTVVEGFTFTEADDPPAGHQGKGMYIRESSPTIRNCRVYFIRRGASVVCENASPVFEGCVWEENSGGCSACKEAGGSSEGRSAWEASAVRCFRNADPQFLNCSFRDNFADEGGGALACDSSSPTLVNCAFVNNIGIRSEGAAVECWNGAAPQFQNCEFTGNYGEGILGLGGVRPRYAGAVYAYRSSPVFEGCIFDSNGVAAHYEAEASAVVIADSLSVTQFANCTFVRNAPVGEYAEVRVSVALATRGGSILLENSLLAYNPESPVAGSDTSATTIQFSCSNVYGNGAGDWVGVIAGQFGVNDNISANPLFCDAAAGDYHTAYESPCASENNSCSVLMGALSPACACCRYRGDANRSSGPDGEDINVSDLTFLVNFVFRDGSPPPCPEEGNANSNGEIDVSDLVFLIDFLFRGGVAPGSCGELAGSAG